MKLERALIYLSGYVSDHTSFFGGIRIFRPSCESHPVEPVRATEPAKILLQDGFLSNSNSYIIKDCKGSPVHSQAALLEGIGTDENQLTTVFASNHTSALLDPILT